MLFTRSFLCESTKSVLLYRVRRSLTVLWLQNFGNELAEAHEWCKKYQKSKREAELHRAWDLYYHVFKRINKMLPTLTVLELSLVAPSLVKAKVRLSEAEFGLLR